MTTNEDLALAWLLIFVFWPIIIALIATCSLLDRRARRRQLQG